VARQKQHRTGYLPWKVRQYECPLFRRHFVLLRTELVEQLFAHRLEDKLEEGVAEDHRRLMPRQTVTERRDVAVAEPPGEPHQNSCSCSLNS